MGIINITVNYKDGEYSDDLSKALAVKNNELTVWDNNKAPSDAIVINEDYAPLFTPVSEIISKIMAINKQKKRPAKPLKDVVYTGFTSATGGSGLSTAAIVYSEIVSRIYGKKIAYVSFDPYYRNKYTDNEYGVSVIKAFDLEEPSLFPECDELVLDIPILAEKYMDMLDMCERRILVMGFAEERRECNEEYYRDLLSSQSVYLDPPRTIRLYNDQDSFVKDNDIHGQLGSQILSMIKNEELE